MWADWPSGAILPHYVRNLLGSVISGVIMYKILYGISYEMMSDMILPSFRTFTVKLINLEWSILCVYGNDYVIPLFFPENPVWQTGKTMLIYV